MPDTDRDSRQTIKALCVEGRVLVDQLSAGVWVCLPELRALARRIAELPDGPVLLMPGELKLLLVPAELVLAQETLQKLNLVIAEEVDIAQRRAHERN
jgi:hypothetical protein